MAIPQLHIELRSSDFTITDLGQQPGTARGSYSVSCVSSTIFGSWQCDSRADAATYISQICAQSTGSR